MFAIVEVAGWVDFDGRGCRRRWSIAAKVSVEVLRLGVWDVKLGEVLASLPDHRPPTAAQAGVATPARAPDYYSAARGEQSMNLRNPKLMRHGLMNIKNSWAINLSTCRNLVTFTVDFCTEDWKGTAFHFMWYHREQIEFPFTTCDSPKSTQSLQKPAQPLPMLDFVPHDSCICTEIAFRDFH